MAMGREWPNAWLCAISWSAKWKNMNLKKIRSNNSEWICLTEYQRMIDDPTEAIGRQEKHRVAEVFDYKHWH